MLSWVADMALQVHSRMDYMKEFPIERIFRNDRVVRIYKRMSEIQKLVTAKELMKNG
jgi:alkylation response protein AidB-like acyl-CoA dehydrogenase